MTRPLFGVLEFPMFPMEMKLQDLSDLWVAHVLDLKPPGFQRFSFNPLPEWNPAGCAPENQPHSICSGVMSWYIPVAFGERLVKLCSVPGVHSSYIWTICGMNKSFIYIYILLLYLWISEANMLCSFPLTPKMFFPQDIKPRIFEIPGTEHLQPLADFSWIRWSVWRVSLNLKTPWRCAECHGHRGNWCNILWLIRY